MTKTTTTYALPDELRDRIARAIRQTREFQAGAAFGIPAEAYGQATDGMADAVIAALGMREERRHGGTTTLNDSVWTRPDNRRWVTKWEEA